ncbi:MAG: hypothetical protein VKN72_26495 [Nostocales cyanobacterium 94392]|nr:hypothetical protein [Nostocales cyanobacterium 94392]
MLFSQFESNKFWYEPNNNERIAHRLYVALCLYISAASDFAVGLDLKNSGKLNWSTTASYYSILHSARLIIFLAIGDYPSKNGHKSISNLFAGKPNPDRADKYYVGDWLEKFANIRFSNVDKFTLDALCHYYEACLQLHHSGILFGSIGKILENAKNLRNNSNYDALLMAHEWHHEQVSDDFVSLSKSMSNGAKLCLEIAGNCFEKYVIYDPIIDDNREKIKYLVKNYIFKRLYPVIEQRIQDKFILGILKESTKKFKDLQVQLEISTNVENELNEFETSFSISRFFNKKSLMDTFKDEAKKLGDNVQLTTNELRNINI